MLRIKMRRIGKDIRFRFPAVSAEIDQTIKEFEKIAVAEHAAVVKTWKHQPEFKVRRYGWLVKGNHAISVQVWTDDPVWRYVDEGTKPHVIRPKKPGGVLAFPSQFKAKTQPQVLKSGTGSSGGATVFSKGVRHPGTKARNFSPMLQRKLDNLFGVMINAAIRKFGPRILG